MTLNLNLNLKNFTIDLSEATIDAFLSHKSFCNAGTGWLVENDPKGKIEQEYFEQACQSFQDDLERSVDNLRSELIETVSNWPDGWWNEINELLVSYRQNQQDH